MQRGYFKRRTIKPNMKTVVKHLLHSLIAAFQWLDTPPGTERMKVRVLPAIPSMVCSSNGLGHKIFILVIWVRFPYKLRTVR